MTRKDFLTAPGFTVAATATGGPKPRKKKTGSNA